MRIALVIPAFLPARDYGGPLYNTVTLACYYVKKGHEVTIYTTNAVSMREFSKDIPVTQKMLGLTVKRFPVIARLGGYWISPSMYSALLKDDFDVIHSQCLRCFQSDIVAHIAKKKHRPLIIAAHGSLGSILSSKLSIKQKFMHMLHNPLDKRNVSIATKLIAVNKFEKSTYIRNGVGEDKIALIPLGLDISEFEQNNFDFRKELGIKSDEVMLLYVGRYNYVKGIDSLIKAFSIAIKSVGFNLRLVLIGKDDGYQSELMNLVKTSGLGDKVIILEGQPRSTIVSAYRACDIFAIPSHFDTFPITMLEAFSSGKAVIASRVGGIPEVLQNERNGLLVEPGDIEALASAIGRLVSNTSERTSFGSQGKITAKTYDITNIAEQTLQLYSQVISEAQASNS